jgi:hypothetical protein
VDAGRPIVTAPLTPCAPVRRSCAAAVLNCEPGTFLWPDNVCRAQRPPVNYFASAVQVGAAAGRDSCTLWAADSHAG